jgi:carbon monoxide dehydrogenase subunit G
MRLEKSFKVDRPRDDVVARLCEDATLIGLIPGSDTEVVESGADHRTTRTRYTALGREGVATFHWHFLLDGGIRFEKVCDGRVWRELKGEVRVDEAGQGSRVVLELGGRTKPLVPEFAIKGEMERQIEEMTRALRRRLRASA